MVQCLDHRGVHDSCMIITEGKSSPKYQGWIDFIIHQNGHASYWVSPMALGDYRKEDPIWVSHAKAVWSALSDRGRGWQVREGRRIREDFLEEVAAYGFVGRLRVNNALLNPLCIFCFMLHALGFNSVRWADPGDVGPLLTTLNEIKRIGDLEVQFW